MVSLKCSRCWSGGREGRRSGEEGNGHLGRAWQVKVSGGGGGPSSWRGGQTWRAVSRREYGLIYVLKGAAWVRVWRLGCRTSKTDWWQ